MGRLGFYLWLLCHASGCGVVRPPPPASCVQACQHLQALGCSTSPDLCGRICANVAPNQPTFPGCVNAATSCQAADACQ